MIALLAVPLTVLSLQQGGDSAIAQRLAGRVPPQIASLVGELGTAAAARGLPVDPLIQKAIEGSAKGVPEGRVAAALNLIVMHLDSAAAALRDGGLPADTLAIAAGEFAITAGLSRNDITALARTGANAAALTVGLRVAGTLAALGVPPAEDIGLVSVELRAGEPASTLLLLPAKVQAEMAKGATAAQAAAGLARAAAAQARRGPPPGRGQGHPQPPHPPPPPPQPHP
jgi:hypothetical protein